MRESLDAILSVLNGTGLLTNVLKLEMDALQAQTVPSTWQKTWEGPENISAWMITFDEKCRAVQNWFERVQSGNLLSSTLHLSELFHPEIFLNALRQQSSRARNISIDGLKLVMAFSESKVNA